MIIFCFSCPLALRTDFTLLSSRLFPSGTSGKESACQRRRQVRSLGQEDPLEEEMATHSSILAWEIHGQRSLAGYSLWGQKRDGHDWAHSFPWPYRVPGQISYILRFAKMPRYDNFRLPICRIFFLAWFLMASFYTQITHCWPGLFFFGYLDSDSKSYQCFSTFNANLDAQHKLVLQLHSNNFNGKTRFLKGTVSVSYHLLFSI